MFIHRPELRRAILSRKKTRACFSPSPNKSQLLRRNVGNWAGNLDEGKFARRLVYTARLEDYSRCASTRNWLIFIISIDTCTVVILTIIGEFVRAAKTRGNFLIYFHITNLRFVMFDICGNDGCCKINYRFRRKII